MCAGLRDPSRVIGPGPLSLLPVDAQTAVLVGAAIVVLCVLAFVLWRARGGPAMRYVDLDAPQPGRTVRSRPAMPLPPELRQHVERLVAAGRPARAINLILKKTDFEIDDAHAAVDAVAAKVAKPGQHAWQAAKAADQEAARLIKEAGNPGGPDDETLAVSAGLIGLDRPAQVRVERMVQGGRFDEAVETVKESTGMTTGQARAGLELIRAQLQRRAAGARTGQRERMRATTPTPLTRSTGRGTAPGDGR